MDVAPPFAEQKMSDTETLKQAIHALYEPTSTEQKRNEANQWLMQFSASPQAWESARALLQEPAEQMQYFGANLLFMKVRGYGGTWRVLLITSLGPKIGSWRGLKKLARYFLCLRDDCL